VAIVATDTVTYRMNITLSSCDQAVSS